MHAHSSRNQGFPFWFEGCCAFHSMEPVSNQYIGRPADGSRRKTGFAFPPRGVGPCGETELPMDTEAMPYKTGSSGESVGGCPGTRTNHLLVQVLQLGFLRHGSGVQWCFGKATPGGPVTRGWTHLWRTGKPGIRCHVALHQSLATQLLGNHSYSVELPAFGHRNHALECAASLKPREEACSVPKTESSF